MNHIYEHGLRFSCVQCSHCCKDEPGYVFLSEKEISIIHKHLGLSQENFIKTYCKKVQMGTFYMLSIIERPNNDCIFLTDSGCSIYPVRPIQCRSYPFWAALVESQEDWDRESEECPGINHGELHKKEEIEEWLEKRKANQPKIFYN